MNTPSKTAVKKAAPRKRGASKAVPALAVPTQAVPSDLIARMIPHQDIDPNLDNVREDIAVDDELREMRDSIAAQGVLEPLVVHEHPDDPARVVLIMGHRRWTAAGLLASPPEMPCIIRPPYATRSLLLAAMVTENGKRKDLSPVEQAKAFENMALEGLNDKAIAAMVSVPARRVTDRRKLLSLRPEHQTKLHTGQLTIDQAAALVEFIDDAKATTEIERALTDGSSYAIKNAITNAKARRDRAAAEAKVKAKLGKAGVQVLTGADLPGQHIWPNPYQLGRSNDLPATRAAHDETGCKNLAAFIRYTDSIEWYCMDPTAHGLPMPGQTDAVDEAAGVESERVAAEAEATRQEQHELWDTARYARHEYLTNLINGTTSLTDDMFAAIASYLAVTAVDACIEAEPKDLVYWLGGDEDLTERLGAYNAAHAGAEQELRDRLAKLPGVRALLALAAAFGESAVGSVGCWGVSSLSSDRRVWLRLVGGPLGYEWSAWEAARLDEADAYAEQAAAEDDDQDDKT